MPPAAADGSEGSEPAPVRIQVAAECGDEFSTALAALVADLPVVLAPIDGAPADAAVVGGRDVATDLELALAAGVRWVQTLTAGVDRVVALLGNHGVIVSNGSAATARPVSEFAMARIMEHAKQLRALDDAQRGRDWTPRWLGALAGSTLTVVGLGPIGARVARLARAFEMHVIGVRRTAAHGSDVCDEVVGADQLDIALARSDYCVLAPALTPETEGMISAAVLAHAKLGLFLVNVGRGGLIDHDALIDAVRDGRITAALDVTPDEPLPADDPLWSIDGILVSPHTATLTPPLVGWLADMVAENIRRFTSGAPLLHVVDTALGYPASRNSA